MSYFQSPTKLATWKLTKAKFIAPIKTYDSIENDVISGEIMRKRSLHPKFFHPRKRHIYNKASAKSCTLDQFCRIFQSFLLTSSMILRHFCKFILKSSARARISPSVGFPAPFIVISCSNFSAVFVRSYAGERR